MRSSELAPVCWHDLDEAGRAAVRGLAIAPRQLEYAGAIDAAIERCEAADPASLRGLALRLRGEPADPSGGPIVGFVVLRRGPALPAWAPASSAVIGGLRIAADRQGQGLGTAAMHALHAWVATQWPDCTTIALRVDDDNAAGIRAYEKAGWRDVGERRPGRVGLERTMARAVAAIPARTGQETTHHVPRTGSR